MDGPGNPDAHVTVLAVLSLAWGGLYVLGALFVVFIGMMGGLVAAALFSWVPGGSESGEALAGLILFFFVLIAFVVLVVGAVAAAAGMGLLRRQEWGRVLTLVLAVVAGLYGLGSLLAFEPVGAVLGLGYGVYAFWALTRPEVVALFRAPGPASA